MDGMIEFERSRYILSQDESERICILKLLMSFMVVFIHSYTEEEFHYIGKNIMLNVPLWLDWIKYIISVIISGCAVPGFFFFSAVLLYKDKFVWKMNLRKKVKTILVPYLIINTFWIGFYFVAQHIDLVSGYFIQRQNIVASWTWKEWIGAYTGLGRTPHGSPIVGAMWFLRDLFILNFFAPVIKWAIDRAPRFIFFILVTTVFVAGSKFPLLRQYALISFCMGYYAVKYNIHFSNVDKLPWKFIGGGYFTTVVLCCIVRESSAEVVAQSVCIFVGICFFIKCTGLIDNSAIKRFFLQSAGYSMPIYLFHPTCLAIIQKLAIRFLPETPLIQTMEYFGLAIGIIGFCVLTSMIFQHIAPRAYAIVIGGRTQMR